MEMDKYFSQIDIVQTGDEIFKDECVYSYDTPESENGIYICMKNFQAVGADFLSYHHKKHKCSVYLNHKRLKYKLTKPESLQTKPKRLAIGVDGGFDPDAGEKDYRYEDSYSLVIMPKRQQIALPNPDLPELYLQSISSIMTAQSTDSRPNETSVWDGEERRVSKYATNLEQFPIKNKIPPSNWKCQECDLKENLWLNLTDGSILCGRRFYDGSGGNNHALEHFEKFKYPLAVKLGTITPDSADIYSYPEEDMVLDPQIAEHLAHFGIDIQKMIKTDKSIIELEIDMNEKIGEWSVIQEEGKNLEPIGGPGFTGLANLGNSCYMNSVLQVLLSLVEFQDRYSPAEKIYDTSNSIGQFNFQMAKLAFGILSGKYSTIAKSDPESSVRPDQKGIHPKSFKHFVCGLNRNFATKRQQDAHEFFLFLMDLIQCNSDQNLPSDTVMVTPQHDPSKCFEVVIEDRIQCLASDKVKYTQRAENCISLDVDLKLASNLDEVKKYKKAIEDKIEPAPELVRPIISLSTLVENFAKPEIIENFYSAAVLSHTMAEKCGKIAKFPRVLVFQIKKFQCGDDWIPKKLDISLEVPDILDLEAYMAKGMQSDEEQIPESSSGGLTDDSYEQQQQQTVKPDEDPKLYQLKAFISHMGTSTMSGHYVCHIRREGKWYIFNDEKVAISENPPRQFGYLFFYERISSTN